MKFIKRTISIFLVTILFVCFSVTNINAGSSYSDILRINELVTKTPFAVKYKIEETNYNTMAMQDAFDRGEMEKVKGVCGLEITDKSIYAIDNKGNERFDYSVKQIPIDRNEELPYIIRETLFKNSDNLQIRIPKKDGSYIRGVTILNNDEFYKNSFAYESLFTNFGLRIISRKEYDGFLNLPQAVKIDQGQTPSLETQIEVTQIPLDQELCTVVIDWGENGLPDEISYVGIDNQWEREYRIIETKEQDGYVYPHRAVYTQYYQNQKILNIIEIEVEEIIIGDAALLKYPVTPPTLPEDAVIQDLRTNK